MSTNIDGKNVKLFIKGKGWRIIEYSPSLFHLFLFNYERMSFQRFVRFVIELFRGYKVYYLVVQNEIVAYSVISKGSGRYNFATKEDIVVGPYYVLENHRGKKYSELLVWQLLNSNKIKYKFAYDWINKNNIPSLKCSRSVGFDIINSAYISKIFRRIIVRNDMEGDYYILKYVRRK